MRKLLAMTKRLLFANLVATAAFVSVLTAGTAYAYFSASGTGTGTTTAGSLQTVNLVAVTGTPTAPLQPGSSGDVLLTLNNPNSFPVTLVSVVANGSISVSGGSSCTASVSGVTFNDQTSLAIPVPVNNSTVDLAGAARMSYSSASGCQGAVFYIPVTITVQK